MATVNNGNDEQKREYIEYGGRYARVKREIPLAAIISGAALAFTFITAGNSLYNQFQSEFAALRSDIRSNTEHRVHHVIESEKIEQQLARLDDIVQSNRIEIKQLQAMPRGGAGISYSDVEKLRERVNQLEDEGNRMRNKP